MRPTAELYEEGLRVGAQLAGVRARAERLVANVTEFFKGIEDAVTNVAADDEEDE